MPYNENQPTLMAYMAAPIVGNLVQKKLLGGHYIVFSRFLDVSSFLYTNGAMLGRVMRERLSTLARLLVRPGNEGYIEKAQDQATARLTRYSDWASGSGAFRSIPRSFHWFLESSELEKMGIRFPGGVPMEIAQLRLVLNGLREDISKKRDYNLPELDRLDRMNKELEKEFSRTLKEVENTLDRKVPWQQAELLIQVFGLEGVGFGSLYPDLTEEMHRNSFELDMDTVSDMMTRGVLSQIPTRVSPEEHEKTVLNTVAAYTREYYPELIEPLGLSEFGFDEE